MMGAPRLTESLSTRQIEQLHDLYQAEWWSKGRSLDDVFIAVENSSLVLGFVDSASDRLIAFCRVLSDGAFRATIYDVIVAEDYRGAGLGARLIDTVLNHPQLRKVEGMALACKPEMVSFYQRFGFAPTSSEIVWMRKENARQEV